MAANQALGRGVVAPASTPQAKPSAIRGWSLAASRFGKDTAWAVLFEAYDWMITKRVVHDYGAVSGFTEAQRERAASVLDDTLDSSGMAVFDAELESLLKSGSTLSYLQGIQNGLEAATPEKPFPLWEYTLERAGSREEAIRWIAVLLQDVTGPVLEGGGFLHAIDDSPVKTQLTATLVSLAQGIKRGAIDAYPPGQEGGAYAYYHYYVPAYLSRRLVEQGIPPRLAFLTVATFNLEYELAHYGVPMERRRLVLGSSVEILDDSVGVSQEDLDRKVSALRDAGSVTNEFKYGDVDLALDLKLTPRQVKTFLRALVEEYDLPLALVDGLARTQPLTLHRLSYAVNVASMKATQDKKSYVALAKALLPAMRQYYKHGLRDPHDLPDNVINEIVLGFAGASEMLPGHEMPLDPKDIELGIETNSRDYMRAVFQYFAPKNYPGLSWDAGESIFERALQALGRPDATGAVAVVDVAFDKDQGLQLRTGAGYDFIDNDSDPMVGGLRIKHGTTVMKIAESSSERVEGIALRADISGVIAALDRAASEGARVVNISQQLTAASLRDLSLFRSALARHPEVLVVLAAGNDGERVGSDPLDLAAMEAPNLVKVASANSEGMPWERTNHHPTLVSLAARGESDRWPVAKWAWASSLQKFTEDVIRGEAEVTSHAAPVVSRVATQVSMLAPWLNGAQVRALLERTADKPSQWKGVVAGGLVNPERALALAGMLALMRAGQTPEEAAEALDVPAQERAMLIAAVNSDR